MSKALPKLLFVFLISAPYATLIFIIIISLDISYDNNFHIGILLSLSAPLYGYGCGLIANKIPKLKKWLHDDEIDS